MKYCSNCGAKLIPHQEYDGFTHYECQDCGVIFQRHPKILAACFIHCGNKMLWMRRAHPPREGYWALPAGFMEQGETLQQAAARELYEETSVVIPAEELTLYMMGSINFINEVYVGFHAAVDSEFCESGDESLDVRFFSREELPWDEIAFPDANVYIVQAYNDIEANNFPVYQAEISEASHYLLAID